jgi:RND family efflux transporter MFP subunit
VLRKRLKFVLPPLIVIGALLLAKVLISSRPELASQPRVDEQPLVQVHTIERQGAAMTLGSHGTVRAKTTLQLTSDVAGRITWVNPALEVGAIIAADTPIARVDRSQYKLAEAQALLALRDAELALADTRSRFETRNPRHPQIRRARAQIAAAKAQIRKANVDLSRTEISLPMEALVSIKQVALGQYVAPGSVLASFQAVGQVEIPLPISHAELEMLEAVDGASVTLHAIDQQTGHWQARLGRLNQQLDDATRVAYAVAVLDAPYATKPALRIGQFVRADIHGVEFDDAFRIPASAVFENRFVYRLDPQQQLQSVAVTLLQKNAQYAVVRGDINVGDQLVLSRLDIMTEGMKVRVESL